MSPIQRQSKRSRHEVMWLRVVRIRAKDQWKRDCKGRTIGFSGFLKIGAKDKILNLGMYSGTIDRNLDIGCEEAWLICLVLDTLNSK